MPRLDWVLADFNELLGDDLLCLTHEDTVTDVAGRVVELRPGLALTAFDYDADEEGRPAHLVARGVAEPSPERARCSGSRWALRIDAAGIRHEPATEPEP